MDFGSFCSRGCKAFYPWLLGDQSFISSQDVTELGKFPFLSFQREDVHVGLSVSLSKIIKKPLA
jgi:hypothetical protein